MSVFDDLGELSTELSSFSNTLYAVVLKAWEHVAETFDSERLEGLNLVQVKARLMAIVTDHTQQLNVNVHNITPEQLNTYSETIVRQMIDELQDKNGDLPYSFYDRQNFLPPMVSSVFASGVYEASQGGGGICLEDSGDLAVLRNGTDGNTRGVFYSIISGASRTNAPILKNTNAQYRPVTLGNFIPVHMVHGTADAILGRYSSENNPTPIGWFIGTTNGTFDQSQHKLVTIPFTVIADSGRAFVIPFNGKLLLFRMVGMGEWEVYESTTANIEAGVSSFSRVTGWQIKLADGSLLPSDNFKHAANFDDLVILTGKPMVHYATGQWSAAVTYGTNTDGSVDLRIRYGGQFGTVDGLGGWLQSPSILDVKLTTAKIIDSSHVLSNRPTVNYTNTSLTLERKGIYAYQHPMDGGGHHQVYEYIGRDRHYTVIFNVTGSQIYAGINRFNPSNRSSYVIDYSGTIGVIPVPVEINFPTPIGHSIVPVCVSPGYALVESVGNSGAVVTSCRIDTGNVVEFTGISGQPVNGYALNIDRTLTSIPVNILRKAVSEVRVSDGQMLTHSFSVSGGDTFSPDTEIGAMSHSPLTSYPAGNNTMSLAAWNKVTVDLRAILLAHYPELHQVVWTVVIPTALVGTGAFITFEFAVGTVERRRISRGGIMSVSYSIGGGILTAVTLNGSTLTFGGATGESVLGFGGRDSGSTSIRACSDGALIVSVSPNGTYHHGNTHTTFRTYRLAGGIFTAKQFNTIGYPDVIGSYNHPTLGLFLTYNSPLNSPDSGTKAVGRLYATTSSNPVDINPYLSGGYIASDRSIISSEVPDKWTVYFSEEVECMIDGVYGKVPPFIYPLNPATDFWKVFHVWLKLENGIFKYVFEKTEYELNLSNISADRSKSLYLGYFATNRYGIKFISIEKSIAVGGYRLSEWKAGKSIPVSNDFPMDLDTLNWV